MINNDNKRKPHFDIGKQEAARALIEWILNDLLTGLNAVEGDIKDAKPDKLNYYLGYRRALQFSVQHIQKIASSIGINFLTIND